MKSLFDKFCFWFVKHIVLPLLLINNILNSLVLIHQIDILGLLMHSSRKWNCSSIGTQWMSSFNISSRLIVCSSSGILIMHSLLTYIWISRLNWNNFLFKSIVKKWVPIYSSVVIQVYVFIINYWKVLNTW